MLFFLKTIKNDEKISSVVTFRMKMYSLGLYDLFIIALIRFSIFSRLGIRVNKVNYIVSCSELTVSDLLFIIKGHNLNLLIHAYAHSTDLLK